MPYPTFQNEQCNLAAKWMESSNILVVVRCRPMSENEKRAKEEDVVSVIDGQQMIIHDPGHTAVNDMRKARVRDRHFAFDHAFGQTTPSDKVYNSTTRFLVDGVVAGFNATVFAYGATGSGKTYTMLGAPQTPGLMVLTLRDLYQEIDRAQAASAADVYDAEVNFSSKKKGSKAVGRIDYKVSLSYVEVYNENIRDLLSESGDSQEFLDLREDPSRGNCVAGVSEHSVSNTNDIMNLLSAGNRRRTQEPTAANKESSRSHAVLQIHVSQHQVKSRNEIDDPFAGFRNGKNKKVIYEGVRKSMGLDRGGGSNAVTGGVIKVGKFSLIDLAGSERAANTHNRGLRLLEGANINRSLLALGNCITALVQGKGSFVPYRDSKLTRLLKDSLGGNCRTVMISCISPAAASFEETCNTLKYANRAKNIRTNITEAVMNKVDVRTHAAEYENLISGLRNEVATLKHKLATTGGMMNTTLAATLGGGGLLAFGGRVSAVSPVEVVTRVSMQKENLDSQNKNQPISSMAPLSSPALKKAGMRSISPIQSPSRGGGGGDRELLQLNIPPSSPGGFQASQFERRSPKSIFGQNNEFSIPDGYVLVNLAEAATAAENLRVLREELVSNFQERMQIQRSLIELHAQTVHNDAEIGRRQVAIARYEQSLRDLEADNPESTAPFSPSSKAFIATKEAASAARHEIQELQNSNQANAKTKNHLISRLKECTDRSEAIRIQLDSQCNTDERRELLALEYRVCLLELDKVELEQSSLLRIDEAEAQRVEIRKLMLALKARDRLLRVQSDLIKKHGLNVDDLARDHDVLHGSADALAAVDAELSSYKTFEEVEDEEDIGNENNDDNCGEDETVFVDKNSYMNKHVNMVNESKEGEDYGKRNEVMEDVEKGEETGKDKFYSPQRQRNVESNLAQGDVSFVESTAEWMGSHFTAQSQRSSTASPAKGSSFQQQPRSPVNPPPAPSSFVVNQSTRNLSDPKNHYVASTNQSLANEKHPLSVSSPPKASSWLERAVQLVRGVKSQMQPSRLQDEKQIDKGGNRISLIPVTSQKTEEFQGPLRPIRLHSLGRINSSKQMSVGEHDSINSLPGPIMPLRDPFDRKAVSRDGLAQESALSAVGMKSDTDNGGGGSSHFSNNDVGLPRRRMYAPETDHAHHASVDDRNWQQDNKVSSSYLPISTTEIRAALVLSEAKTASADASSAASVAALQRIELLVKRTSNERLIPLNRGQANNKGESKNDDFEVYNQRRDNFTSNQEDEEDNESGLSYVHQVKLMQPVQQQSIQNHQITCKPLSSLPSSRRSLSDGVMQGEERRLQQAPATKKEPVWLKAIPPHRPPISNALKMARAAELREKKEALERAASFDAAPSQATSLNHAIAAYSAPNIPSRKAQIMALGAQRQPSAPRAIRDPDERALH